MYLQLISENALLLGKNHCSLSVGYITFVGNRLTCVLRKFHSIKRKFNECFHSIYYVKMSFFSNRKVCKFKLSLEYPNRQIFRCDLKTR